MPRYRTAPDDHAFRPGTFRPLLRSILLLLLSAPLPAAAQAAQYSGSRLLAILLPLFLLVLTAIVVAAAVSAMRKERRRAEQVAASLREQNELLQILTDGIKNTAVVLLDGSGRISHWNNGAARLFGHPAGEITGKPLSALFPLDDTVAGRIDTAFRTCTAEGRHEMTAWLLRRDGASFHSHISFSRRRNAGGGDAGYAVVVRDMTEMKHAEELLKKLSLSVEQSADIVMITSRAGAVEYVNKAVEDATGYSREEVVARGLEALKSEHGDPNLFKEMWNTVLSGFSFQAEVTIRKKNGEQTTLDEVVTPITDAHGNVTHALITASDITPLKAMKEKLTFLTSYDDLTGLPNRGVFVERLNRDRTRASKGTGTMAVLTIDIDRFKYINEIYGLDAGNKVLKQVAESLSVSVSKDDTVARLGSDEFGIILHDIRKPTDVILFVKMIMKNVPQIIMSGGEEISVTLACGISLYPDDGKDANTLMRNADTALGKAKALGRNNYQFYTSDMNVGVTELVLMERRLVDALKNKEYMLTYQPYCYLSSGRVAGAEALIKWKNEEFGMVSPVKFIPMLEETGMIIDVGKWVLRTACAQIKAWGNGNIQLPVSVNLSFSQFRHEFLAETVEGAIREYAIDPTRLTLEITESTFMKDQEPAIAILKRLKSLGVAISIDDFGTGYSSLSYLKRFPVDYVKIDLSFVKDVATDPDATSLVSAIINMAHSLSLRTIAEGVETEDQWKILRLLKCDMAQGYFFSRAVTAPDIEKLIE